MVILLFIVQNARDVYIAANNLFNAVHVNRRTTEALSFFAGASDDYTNDVTEVMEEMRSQTACTDIDTLQGIKKQSPFTHYFRNAIRRRDESDTSDSSSDHIDNEFYSPPSFRVLSSVIHLIPLWSAMLYSAPQRGPLSNAAVESYFKTVKHGMLSGRKRLRIAEFLQMNLERTQARLNELQLPKVPRELHRPTLRLSQDTPEVWGRKTKRRKYSDAKLVADIFSRASRKMKDAEPTRGDKVQLNPAYFKQHKTLQLTLSLYYYTI
jgi:hypothetical protein